MLKGNEKKDLIYKYMMTVSKILLLDMDMSKQNNKDNKVNSKMV